MSSSAASSIGSIVIAGKMPVFKFRITSLAAQTKVIVHSDQFRSPLRPKAVPLWTVNVRVRLPTSLCCADGDRLACDTSGEIVYDLLGRAPVAPPGRHPRPSPMGGVADFDEKDTHRRVLEVIPHRPLGTLLAPIRYERAGLASLASRCSAPLRLTCSLESASSRRSPPSLFPVWVRAAALH